MARTLSISSLAFFVGLFSRFTPSECGGYAAFITDLGTQLIVLNSARDLEYSPCNSGSTPAWPDSPPVLPISVSPRSGSNIAAVGYVEDDAVYADVFWQNSGFNLEHERFKCNMTDGNYTLVSHESPDEEASGDMPDVSIFTGLATVRLAEEAGTRLFFQDSNASLNQLEYTTSGAWKYVGKVSPDDHLQGPSVGAAVIDGTAEMYVVEARSDSNLEVASTLSGDPWNVETTPRSLSNSDVSSTSTQNFTVNATEVVFAYLEAWPSQVGNLGLAIDQDESKYIFYIGSDKSLYYVSSIEGTNLGSWSVYDSLSTEYWPLADDEAADFAVASDPSTYDIRIYYMSGGSMTEVSRTEKDTWAEAAALPTKASTTASESSASATASSDQSSSSASSAGSTSTTAADKSSGLSTGAQAGIGIGAGFAGLVVVGASLGCYFARRKAQRQPRDGDEIALASHKAGLDHPGGAKRGSSLLDESGRPKDEEAPRALVPGAPGGAALAGTATPNASVVYVPAYELPASAERATLEMPGTPIARPSVVSELGSTAPAAGPPRLQRPIHASGAQHAGAASVSDVADATRPLGSASLARSDHPPDRGRGANTGRTTGTVPRGPGTSPMSELDSTPAWRPDFPPRRPGPDAWNAWNAGDRTRGRSHGYGSNI